MEEEQVHSPSQFKRRMREEVYTRLLLELESCGHIDQESIKLLKSIPRFSSKMRVELIRLARSPDYPMPGTTRHKLISRHLSDSILNTATAFLDSHVLRSILLWCARNGPISPEQIRELEIDSFVKEFALTQKPSRPQLLNYSSIFRGTTEPLHPDIPYNQHMIDTVRSSILQWLRNASSRTYYPKLSTKTTSKETKQELDRIFPGLGKYTQVEIERAYVQYEDVKGSCEMRQVFYQSQFPPRTYYCAGAYAFLKSKYCATLMTELCDSFPPSARHLRMLPNRLVLRADEYGLIYDLTTFTSNLSEHEYFLRELSEFSAGYTTTVLDGRHGPITVEMSTLINDLADVHKYVQFTCDLHGLNYKGQLDLGGMLGIYGNISSATFLHALVATQVVSSTDKANIAGDDGMLVVTKSLEPIAIKCIQTLGDLSVEKVYRTFEDGCISLKRGIVRLDNCRLGFYPNIVPPSLDYSLMNKLIDPRYHQVSRMTKRERKNAAASTVKSFLQSLTYYTLSDWESSIAETICKHIYSVHGLPCQGNVPQCGTMFKLGFVPTIHPFRPNENVIDYTLRSNYANYATVQVRKSCEFQPKPMLEEDEFECNTHPFLTYCVKMGYLLQESTTVVMYGQEGLVKLREEYYDVGRVLYRYKVINSWVRVIAPSG